MRIKLFSGHWCPECAAREELFIQLCDKYDIDLEILQVEEENARKQATKYHVQSIPMALVMDKIPQGDMDEVQQRNVLVQFGPNIRDDVICNWLEERMTFDAESNGGSPEAPGEEDVPR